MNSGRASPRGVVAFVATRLTRPTVGPWDFFGVKYDPVAT